MQIDPLVHARNVACIELQAKKIDNLERQLAELREAAEAELVKLACAGVEKLTEIAPDAGWDSGEVVAEMYIRRLPDTSAPKDSEKPRCEHGIWTGLICPECIAPGREG